MPAAPAPAPWLRSGVLRYGAALLAVAVAVGLRGVLDVWMAGQSPFLTVLGAVAVAVWLGGAGPAVLAAGVGFIAAARVYMGRDWLFVAWDASHWATLVSYAFSAGLIVVFGHALLRSRRRCEQEIDERRLAQAATLVERRRLEIALKAIGEGVQFADLTARMQIEDSLRRSDSLRVESEAQARLALDIARLGTWSWEVVDDVVTADARTREITGLPALSEAPTFRLADVVGRIHDADWWRVEAALAAAIHPDSGGRYAEEFRFAAPSGRERQGADATASAEPRWVLAHGQALFDTDGPVPRVTRVLGSLLDITERKRTEEALAQADRRKDEFIATLAHELRNPLAPLRNGVHLLRVLLGPNADPAQDKLAATAKPLAIMERQIAHMVRLIDDLLDVARINGGKLELQRHRFDIADAVQQAIETSQPLIQAAGHTLTVVLPAQPVHVDADVTRLCQVIANLLNNAAKYTPSGGQLRLGVEPIGDDVAISVEDSGRGLAPEMLPKIFQMFTQVDRHHERSSGGLGIGLAIARRLVEMHGGDLRATSRGLGQGSRFVMRLPRVDEAGPSHRVSHDGAAQADEAARRDG